MAHGKIFTSVFVTIMLYIMFLHGKNNVVAAPGASSTSNAHRVRNRPLFRLAPRPLNQYARLKSDIGDLVVDDDDFFDMNKRQTSDDYGHLRFGKRDEFDDYGHMRFGRAGGADNARE